MTGNKLISIILCLFILVPLTRGWGQNYEDQEQFYLQNIGPGAAPSQAPSQPSSQAPTRSDLPQQGPSRAQPAQILTTAPRQPEEISEVERRAWAKGMFLKQYGYSFFYQPPASFLPVQSVPVGPDYIIGPGDTLKIIIWGSVQEKYNLTVNRNGQVDIPKVGMVQVSGLTYKQLIEVLDREFAHQYNNFQMNVTLDNLRTIQVFVGGQARFPGSYAVSSLSTLVGALFASGGPSKSGSMRNIQVRRGGKVVTTFDMYDLFLRGDKSKDIRLQSKDVIFIPPIGPRVAVGTPKSMKDLGDELKTLARVKLQQRSELSQRNETASASQAGQSTAPPENPLQRQFWLQKENPATWQQDEDLRIITGRKTPQEMVAQEQKRDEIKPMYLKPSPKNWWEVESDQQEVDFEKQFGLSLPEAANKLGLSKELGIGGPVKVPGIYELKNEKGLKEILHLAGGLGDTAFKGRVQVLRVQNRQAMVLFDDDLGKLDARRQDFRIVDGDFVEIFPVPSQVEKKLAIAGAVKNPGEFGFRDNMRVSDLVAYAGGLLQQADKSEAEITRVTITPQGPQTTRLNIRLFGALNYTPGDNIVLKPNDYLLIRPVPNWNIYKTVQITGEVKSPGAYALKTGETLSSVLARAGGFTDKAYLLGGVLVRESTRTIQRQQLNAAIDRLEAQVMASGAVAVKAGTKAGDTKSAAVAARQQQLLFASLRKVEPLGRVVIHLDDPARLRGTPDDITLEEGDRLMVPQVQSTVNVVGAVFTPTALVYQRPTTVKEYITKAGGTTEIADGKEIYVIKANGAAVSRKGSSLLGDSWDGSKYGYHPGGISSLTLDPGDTIVVPEKLERIAWLKESKNLSTILATMAVAHGVVLHGLKQ